MTTETPVWERLAELRSVSERDMESRVQKLDAAVASFSRSVQSIRLRSEQTIDKQAKVGKLKAELREVEDHLVKSLAVKTRKEAKRMATVDSISVTKAQVEELQRVVKCQSDRTNKYTNILSETLEAISECKEKVEQDGANGDEMKEAFAWYNDALGLYIEGGHGVRFTFTKIDKKRPDEKYTFSVRHANNVYTLIDCNPQLDGIDELVNELNKSNGLFKFVKIMRAKFQEYSGAGSARILTSSNHDAVELSLAAPPSMVSTDSTSDSPVSFRKPNRDLKKHVLARGVKPSVNSPASASGSSQRRRSPRFIR